MKEGGEQPGAILRAASLLILKSSGKAAVKAGLGGGVFAKLVEGCKQRGETFPKSLKQQIIKSIVSRVGGGKG